MSNRLLIVFAFSYFVAVVAVVVPVVPGALAFVVLSFALVFAFPLPLLYHVAPMSIGAGPWLLLPDVIACNLVNVLLLCSIRSP